MDTLSILVNPKIPLRPKITEITGITDMMLADKETAETAIPKLMDFIGDAAIAAHNAAFDGNETHEVARILEQEAARLRNEDVNFRSEKPGSTACEAKLRDFNGNTVGRARFSKEK